MSNKAYPSSQYSYLTYNIYLEHIKGIISTLEGCQMN